MRARGRLRQRLIAGAVAHCPHRLGRASPRSASPESPPARGRGRPPRELMLSYLARRVVYTVPILIGVSLVCFALVHIAPGDPLVSVLPPDASADLQKMMLAIYGFDRPYAEQFAKWIWRALHGDLGSSIATGRPVADEVIRRWATRLRLAVVATFVGFLLRLAVRLRRRLFPRLLDRQARFGAVGLRGQRAALLARHGAGHHLRGRARLAAADRRRARRLERVGVGLGRICATWSCRRVTMSVIPMGIIARTVRALVADILAQEFIVGLARQGSRRLRRLPATSSRTPRRPRSP